MSAFCLEVLVHAIAILSCISLTNLPLFASTMQLNRTRFYVSMLIAHPKKAVFFKLGCLIWFWFWFWLLCRKTKSKQWMRFGTWCTISNLRLPRCWANRCRCLAPRSQSVFHIVFSRHIKQNAFKKERLLSSTTRAQVCLQRSVLKRDMECHSFFFAHPSGHNVGHIYICFFCLPSASSQDNTFCNLTQINF